MIDNILQYARESKADDPIESPIRFDEISNNTLVCDLIVVHSSLNVLRTLFLWTVIQLMNRKQNVYYCTNYSMNKSRKTTNQSKNDYIENI